MIILSDLELMGTLKTHVPSGQSRYLLITSKISDTEIWAWPKVGWGPNCALVTLMHHISPLHITLETYLASKSHVPSPGHEFQMRRKRVPLLTDLWDMGFEASMKLGMIPMVLYYL